METHHLKLHPNHQAVVNRFVAACQADGRILAAFLGSSYARDAADVFSDPEAGDEPYFKIEKAMPVEQLSALQATFCPMEKDELLKAGRLIVRFYKEVAIPLAQAHRIPYPDVLERVMISRLENLREPAQWCVIYWARDVSLAIRCHQTQL